jgi:RNA recognition motif-containing protein
MNIFVGNLNYRVDEDGLRGLFEEYGDVSDAKIIMDRETGRSRGFGFVIMDNERDAEAAIEELSGSTFENREMVVNQAREKKRY